MKLLIILNILILNISLNITHCGAATISGQIIDTHKNLLRYFMQSNTGWNGKFDSITSPMVKIMAFQDTAKVGETNPTENGYYTINTTGEADKIILSVPDGGYYLVHNGYWPEDAVVDLNIATIPSYVIKGIAKHNGNPLAFEGVSAIDANGEVITRFTTRSNGAFFIHSSVPIKELKTFTSSVSGPWIRDTEVNIE